jgi:hypothetical protein
MIIMIILDYSTNYIGRSIEDEMKRFRTQYLLGAKETQRGKGKGKEFEQ